MSSSKDTRWAADIRRYIYEILLLVVLLILIATGFSQWRQHTEDLNHRYSNDYHLASTSHYLKAMEELRHILNNLTYDTADLNTANPHPGSESPDTAIQPADDINPSILFYLIQQELKAGLALHQQFGDTRLDLLSRSLNQQLTKYQYSSQTYLATAGQEKQIISDIRGLLTTLSQLERLHIIIRSERLDAADRLQQQQNLIFYILLAVLLVTGIVTTRRGLKAINLIIDQHQAAKDKISHQANFDSLTHLPNRFMSMDRLSHQLVEALRHQQKVAVVFIDLDDFKKINDTLGHEAGDKLLVEAAQRLRNTVRSGDTVGRLGGDEFIVILGEIEDALDVRPIALNIIEQIRQVFKIDGREMLVSASAGISIFPDDGQDASTLLRNADSAMYHSKDLGRNTFCYFTDEMNREAAKRLAIEEQLHGALDRNEFYLVYQQQVELVSNQIIGAEALLRWNNPELGMVSPDEFIPIAEQTGLIVPIGQFVLTQALAMTVQWQQHHSDFRIAVNLSPRQFRDPQLVNHIEAAIKQAGISPKTLELEITEGVLLSGHNYIDDALKNLNELGIGIAMDDFGTGYSSISYLRSYPFDVIKVDRSFVGDIATDPADRELINAAISMAHALNLQVIAEGVETKEQLNYLREMGCDFAQGYLFSKPVSADIMRQQLQPSTRRVTTSL